MIFECTLIGYFILEVSDAELNFGDELGIKNFLNESIHWLHNKSIGYNDGYRHLDEPFIYDDE